MHPRVKDLLAHPEKDPATASEIRRRITRSDPLRFALMYFSHHMRLDGQLTLSEFHTDLAAKAKAWMEPVTEPGAQRDAIVAPRDAAKSTWCFLFLPMWAAAHGHLKFVAAFADSAWQAENHLSTFREELRNNTLLQTDYPDLCSSGTGKDAKADRQDMYRSNSGFAFVAKGIDAKTLGLKVGAHRPDLLLFDDVEPDESNYSLAAVTKRLGTIRDAILPMNLRARAVLVGTVVRAGSIIHQLVRHHEDPQEWITEDGWRVHHYHPILKNKDGTERSLWPEKWPLWFLKSIAHTRSFAKNFSNRPMPRDGTWWSEQNGDIRRITGLTYQRTIMSIDPAVTSKDSSDETGIAIMSRSGKRTVVHYAQGFRIAHGEPMKKLILRLLQEFPQVSVIRIEDNQGKDLWRLAMDGIPVRVVLRDTKASKEARFAWLLNRYQIGACVHDRPLPEAEEQMYAYPMVTNDDVIDAIALGDADLNPPTNKKKRPAVRRVAQV